MPIYFCLRISALLLLSMHAYLHGAATSSQLIPDKSVAIQQFKNYRFEGDYNLLSNTDALNRKHKTTTCICSPDDATLELSVHTALCFEERQCKRCRPLIDYEWQEFNATKEQREHEEKELRAQYGNAIAICSDGPDNRCQCFYKRIDEILVVDDANEHTHRLFFPPPVRVWQPPSRKKGNSFFVPSNDLTMIRLSLALRPIVEPTMQKFYWQRLAILLGIPLIGRMSARLCSTINPRILAAVYGACGIGYILWASVNELTHNDSPRPLMPVDDAEVSNLLQYVKSNYITAIEQARDALCATKQLTQRQVHYNQISAAVCINRIQNIEMNHVDEQGREALNSIASKRLQDAQTRRNEYEYAALWHAGSLFLGMATRLFYQSYPMAK